MSAKLGGLKMFIGTRMTPAAAVRLKAEGLPQERAVCVPTGLWDEYALGETPIERSCYVMQVVRDLADYSSDNQNRSRLAGISSVTLKWGMVAEFRDVDGRKVRDLDPLIDWINKKFIDQPTPEVAVREDGVLIRVLLGQQGAGGITFHKPPFWRFASRAACEGEHQALMRHRMGEGASRFTLPDVRLSQDVPHAPRWAQ